MQTLSPLLFAGPTLIGPGPMPNSESDIDQDSENQGGKLSTGPSTGRSRRFWIVRAPFPPLSTHVTSITGSGLGHWCACHRRHWRGCGHFHPTSQQPQQCTDGGGDGNSNSTAISSSINNISSSAVISSSTNTNSSSTVICVGLGCCRLSSAAALSLRKCPCVDTRRLPLS